MMGIGGGSFGVPAMRPLHGVSSQRAVATSSGFGLIISLPAFFALLVSGWSVEGFPPWTSGFANLPLLVLIVAFSTLTVPLSVRLSHHLPAARLKTICAAVITLTSANMLIKGLGGL